ncbi:MAG: CotH kinase family protein [Chloroflexi bacterium]|nr:CotH kinase family protein [Chloroflexota bacterium]MCY3581534.1 CotH kinase family protein [Chloroflexota bacterium]MCY3716580.1 CotH kinase family protein [Chloroflexota bacterium]MXX51094.1 hypothetical protein [Chloroflexota bacterium]MXX83069.1 hypothetical protein [Chloroflexota bacterium]
MHSNFSGMSLNSFIAALLAWLLTIAAVLPSSAQTSERPAGWTDESHGNRAPANYAVVLPDDRINELYITFTPESWADQEADMTKIYGERGAAGTGFGRRGGAATGDAPGIPPQMRGLIAEVAAALDRSEEQVIEAMQLMPDFDAIAAALAVDVEQLMDAVPLPGNFGPPAGQPGRQRGGADEPPANMQLARNPIWVSVTVQFADGIWHEVGFRFKGNSTLSMGWGSGETGLPFKLDFDEFEDDNPALQNQRFYGFKQLSFARSPVIDSSQQREKVATDIFRSAGVPAAETAFYAVYVDIGDGAGNAFWGIYTAIELPDDTLIETQFADDNGNMYKPEGTGATFAKGAFREESFDKETNSKSDYADVLAVFDALHALTRQSDPEAWRAGLEAALDVNGFLRWLAVNTLIQNWDTYGNLPHNYYLYADETSGALVWVPWDNNMALSSDAGTQGGMRGLRAPLTLSLADVDADAHPLIGFLMADPVYHSRYVALVAEVSSEMFTPARMKPIYEANYELLAAYLRDVGAHDDLADLRVATDGLIEHVHERAEAADSFLANVLD